VLSHPLIHKKDCPSLFLSSDRILFARSASQGLGRHTGKELERREVVLFKVGI
jgi:hypothetical protein